MENLTSLAACIDSIFNLSKGETSNEGSKESGRSIFIVSTKRRVSFSEEQNVQRLDSRKEEALSQEYGIIARKIIAYSHTMCAIFVP